MTALVLDKVKQPGARVFSFEMLPLADDAAGHWFHMPVGARWSAPHDAGALPFDVVVLLDATLPWVAWWVPHPGMTRLEVDVCLPPARTARGWRYVDLELDVFRYRHSGQVTIEDRDEFDDAVLAGAITSDDARLADQTTRELEATLTHGEPAWLTRGWELLDAATGGPPGAD